MLSEREGYSQAFAIAEHNAKNIYPQSSITVKEGCVFVSPTLPGYEGQARACITYLRRHTTNPIYLAVPGKGEGVRQLGETPEQKDTGVVASKPLTAADDKKAVVVTPVKPLWDVMEA